MPGEYHHLLGDAVPDSYDVRLAFRDLRADAEFEGSVTVALTLPREATRELVLHGKALRVQRAWATGHAGAELQAAEVVADDAHETLTFRFAEALPCRLELHCEYVGRVNGPLLGLYHCSFDDGTAGVSSHFEPVYARYALPCIDEPRAKARFRLAIAAPEGLTVLSNMPAVSREARGEGLLEHKFGETPRMSTYLLAVSIGPFDQIEPPPGTETPVPMALYAPPGSAERGRFALEVAAFSLGFFEDFFKVKFPLPKLDLVVPPSFPIGGMENWGLISLTNRALIDDDASLQKRRGVATLVAHEVSHMWFGDLVTPCWWEDLWLKEGFASWVSFLPLDALFPQWRVWDRWAAELLYGGGGHGSGGALETDQYRGTHAIEVRVNHPSEVQEIFDALSYDKGSAMVNMLFHLLGKEAFCAGLSAWLQKHSFGNSCTAELWDELGRASGQPISAMMASWTRQEGFPLVEVGLDAAGDSWTVSQCRFGLDGEAAGRAGQLWHVPLGPLHADGTAEEGSSVLTSAQGTLPRRGAWVKLNAGGRSPYRVRYAPELLDALAAAATDPRDVSMAPLDRVGLASDGFALLRSGRLAVGPLLGMLRRQLSAESDALVLGTLLGVAQRLLDAFAGTAPALRGFFAGLLGPLKERLGWAPVEGEAEDDRVLRPSLLSVLGACQDEAVAAEAGRQTSAYLASVRGVLMAAPAPPADVRGVVLRIGAASAPELWEPLRARLAAATGTEERDQLLVALMGHSDRAVLQDWVAGAVSGALPQMEWATMFAGLARNRHHRGLAWDMLVQHWGAVFAAWGRSQFKMKAIVASAMSGAEAADVERFFAQEPCPVVAKTIERGLEALAADAALRERWPEVDECLQSLSGGG